MQYVAKRDKYNPDKYYILSISNPVSSCEAVEIHNGHAELLLYLIH